ncbi:MAG: SGNH/GDSL hydrolase family protein [Saprospiraceae bacterium]|nr:SGNH/GDSL hydrolase family protein [Saprospiraceae bacterium]
MSWLKYILGLTIATPLAPIMWLQGRQILKHIPQVPEPEDHHGVVGDGDALIKILGIGESSIASIGARTSQLGLVGQVAAHMAEESNCEIHWQVVAESGLTIKNMLVALIPKCQKMDFNPDLLLLGVGVNEVFKLNHPVGFRKDLETLIHVLKSQYPGVPLVFIHMPPIRSFPVWTSLLRYFTGELGDIFEKEMEQMIQSHNQTYYCQDRISLDKFKAKLNRPAEDAEFFSDGVHPSELTYHLWGREIGSFILAQVPF